MHDRKRQRYRCHICGRTFSARRGTMFEGLRTSNELVVVVVTLLAFGCPIQAIVQAYGLDERTVASWRDRAGQQCQRVHQGLIKQGQLNVVHVQADTHSSEGRGNGCVDGIGDDGFQPVVAVIVSRTRASALADRLLYQVRTCCRTGSLLLVCTDGWAAYPGSIKRAFQDKVKEIAGRGRACLRVWSGLCIARVIKPTVNKRVVGITRQMMLGTLEHASSLLQASRGGTVLNTAFIERLNGTMRERLARLTRKCRHAAQRVHPLETGMYLIGSTYTLTAVAASLIISGVSWNC
jgi:hypothetical protein